MRKRAGGRDYLGKRENERARHPVCEFEAPNKESVYAEYMPDSVRVYGSESRLDAALPELAAQGLPVYDMKPELLKEADTYQLYYKYDTHWNQIGSFIGSQADCTDFAWNLDTAQCSLD